MEQELVTLSEHLSSSRVRVAQYLVFSEVICFVYYCLCFCSLIVFHWNCLSFLSIYVFEYTPSVSSHFPLHC